MEDHFLRRTRCDWIVWVFCTKVDQRDIATWKNTCAGWDSLFWQRVAKWCWHHISTRVEQVENYITCVPPIPPTEGHKGGNFGWSPPRFYWRHSLTTTALWKTDWRNATSFCALALCQMIFHLGEVEMGILFCHLCDIDFLRPICLVIHFLPYLGK